jgi:hypothetical protein
VKYLGTKRVFSALMESDDFCGFLGCIRVDLHDKVVNGVNHHNKVYIVPVFHSCSTKKCGESKEA